MATPVVAAAALLVRQYFMDGFYPSGSPNPSEALTPSSALVKAVLLGGAESLGGFEADTGLPIDPPPSYRQGYGRVYLGGSLFVANNPYNPVRLQVLDKVGITGSETHQYCIRTNGGPITITLVWTDYPGSPVSRKALVNDLDLTVRAEGFNGIPVMGNGGSVTDSSRPDSENNVEQVYLPSVPAGQLSIEVKGSSVQSAFGAQPYALVVNGDFTGNLVNPEAGGGDECAVVVPKINAGPPALTNEAYIVFEFSTQSGSSQVGVFFFTYLISCIFKRLP